MAARVPIRSVPKFKVPPESVSTLPEAVKEAALAVDKRAIHM